MDETGAKRRLKIMRVRALWVWLGFALAAGGCGSEQGEVAPDRKGKVKESTPEELAAAEARRFGKLLEEIDAEIEKGDLPRATQLAGRGLKELIKMGERTSQLEVIRASLLRRLGDVARTSGRQDEARRHYGDALSIYRLEKNPEGQFRVYRAYGLLEEGRGDYSAVEREYAQAQEFLSKIENPQLLADFHVDLGRLASRQLEREKASQQYLEAIRLYDVAGNKRARAEVYLLLATEEDAMGKTDEAGRSLQKALNIFRDVSDPEGEVRAVHRMANVAKRDEKYRLARRLFKKVHKLYLDLDNQAAATKVIRQLSSLPKED